MPENHVRPDWDTYFLEIMRAVATRATCDRGRSGAVIVKDKRIICTGYVGAPRGLPHCDEVGHLFKESIKPDGTKTQNCVRTTHAEMNAIIQAALHGVSVNGSTLYCRMTPCLDCTKAIISAGIKRVVCERRYKDDEISRQFLKDAGVELVVLSNEIQQYPSQDGQKN
ncbi:MAG: cytidine/deoxycytidylate deaminase family protein [Candidatus Aenigmatarchaeota archaeon]|nr:cytidine/deoxycytidylate deaminase family protein [Candidatus Aenigmarchaeota archaeon]